jgi:HTH-type transcriptional regulator/antitoxin HipB
VRKDDQAFAHLAATVRARRKVLGLRQEEVALFAGCGDVFIYRLEQGKPTVRLDKVLDVMTVLGLQLRIETGNEGIVVG